MLTLGPLRHGTAFKAATLLALQAALLAFFTSRIPLHRMYGLADSGEYQRMALFIAERGTLSGGYAQFFPPGLPLVVATIFQLTQNIDYASLIANFLFAFATLLSFLFWTKSLRLSAILAFIPYWIILSFSTLADASFIFLELTALYLFLNKRQHLSLFVAAISTLFRLEGMFVVPVLLLALWGQKGLRAAHLLYMGLAVAPLAVWGFFAFGDPLINFRAQAGQAWDLHYVATTLLQNFSLGPVGVAKVGYVSLTLIASVLTIVFSYRKFGAYSPLFLLSLVFTFVHTLLSPIHIFPDMARLFLYVAPITLLVFKRLVEKWFVPIALVLAPFAIFVAYVFWTVTFSVPFL